MNYNKTIFLCLMLMGSVLSAGEFTLSSYNCGGLSDHYDYLRAASMQKLMQERYNSEPENMSLNEKIQQLALKIQFSPDAQERFLAQQEWTQKNYQQIFEQLTAAPANPHSPNAPWNQKADAMITSHKIRPVTIYDKEVNQILNAHCQNLAVDKEADRSQLRDVRATMAKRIFAHHLKYDIICLQEADYLDNTMFPEHYAVLFSDSSHSKNGVAWNKDRFECVKTIGNILHRAFAIKLLDKESGLTILVASGHISGCDPYRRDKDPTTGVVDSAKGDGELHTILQLFNEQEVDLLLIGMDSNVTALHPRLHILKDAGYQLDYENHLENTCTNPYQVLNTRIDWIALKSKNTQASVTNIPVLGVGLNSIETNISDHKPIAAKVTY